MRFGVLGALEVVAGGVALPLGTRRQRSVLAVLAVNAGRVVVLDELVDELWPGGPPASAVPNGLAYARLAERGGMTQM